MELMIRKTWSSTWRPQGQKVMFKYLIVSYDIKMLCQTELCKDQSSVWCNFIYDLNYSLRSTYRSTMGSNQQRNARMTEDS